MWRYSRELFLSNWFIFTCILDRQKNNSPEHIMTWHMKLKKSIESVWVRTMTGVMVLWFLGKTLNSHIAPLYPCADPRQNMTVFQLYANSPCAWSLQNLSYFVLETKAPIKRLNICLNICWEPMLRPFDTPFVSTFLLFSNVEAIWHGMVSTSLNMTQQMLRECWDRLIEA